MLGWPATRVGADRRLAQPRPRRARLDNPRPAAPRRRRRWAVPLSQPMSRRAPPEPWPVDWMRVSCSLLPAACRGIPATDPRVGHHKGVGELAHLDDERWPMFKGGRACKGLPADRDVHPTPAPLDRKAKRPPPVRQVWVAP